MARFYLSTMDALYRLSIWVAGIALIIMVVVIPMGIFARYIQNDGLSWPEPVAILCMVTFTFIGAAASYRSGSHIAVSMVTDRLSATSKKVCLFLVDLLMIVISLFILIYSYILCSELWSQPVAEFPLLTAGQTYIPLPIGSAITLCFILERLFFGPQTHRPVVMIGNS